MSQQLLEKEEKAEDIESQIQSLAEEGGIDIGHISTERRRKLVSRLQGVSQPRVNLYSIPVHGPG